MLDSYKVITVTHKRINLKNISDFVVHPSDDQPIADRLHELKGMFQLQEVFYLSTCNRVLFLISVDQDLGYDFVRAFLTAVNPSLSSTILAHIEDSVSLYQGLDAVKHLFEVASSIDSLVIGERQILGQLREAYEFCRKEELTGDRTRILMDAAVQAAKSVYSQTKIGDKPVSVVSLAIRKLLNTGLPKSARILLVGAGQTNELVAKFLAKHQYDNVTIFNRSLDKARTLAETVDGKAFSLEQIPDYHGGFDCMIVCTGSKRAIIDLQRFQYLLGSERNKKIVIDLAIPHNVEQEVIDTFNPTYIEIEGLRHLADENIAFREKEVQRARELLKDMIEGFPATIKQRQLEIAMRAVPSEIKAVKAKALNEVFRKDLDSLDETTLALVERMMTYMEKKCIGIPMKAAREIHAQS